jgi:pimeloyl-ACP methyl ester carboxylesterase
MKFAISLVTAALLSLPATAYAEEGTFASEGVPLHFTDEGTGPTVLMLHAFAGSSTLWESNELMSLDGFRTISFDARGHGQSGKPLDPDSYGEQLVEDVIGLMDARSVDAAHLVGYSMGAETALKLVTEHPDRVLSLVVGGSGWSGDEEKQTYEFISGALGDVETFGDFMASMSTGDENMSEDEQMAGFAMLTSHGISPMQESAPLAATAGEMHKLIGLSGSQLSAISVPVLGITGETDEERENVERLGEQITDYSFVLVPGADHLSAPLTPLFTQSVSSFLQEVSETDQR